MKDAAARCIERIVLLVAPVSILSRWLAADPMIPMLGPCVAVVSYAIAPHRWQQLPLQFGLLVEALVNFVIGPSALCAVLAVAGAFVSAGLSLLLPPFDMPLPSGPFTVGRRTIELTDASRRGWVVGDDGPRRLVVDVWYPASRPGKRRVPYISSRVLDAVCKEFRMPRFPFRHVAAVCMAATDEAPLLEHEWPVVLFSHALSGVRGQNSALLQELASHGHVVLTADHPYDAILTAFEDGAIAPMRFMSHVPPTLSPTELLAFRLQCAQVRADDLAFVLDAVLADKSFHRGALTPTTRAHVIGHSCGGGAAVLFAQQHASRCASCVSVDGFLWWLGRRRVLEGVPTPLLALRSTQFLSDMDEYVSGNVSLTQQLCAATAARGHPVASAVLSGVSHFDYTDITLGVAPWLLRRALISEVTGAEGLALQRWLGRVMRAFMGQTNGPHAATTLVGALRAVDLDEIEVAEPRPPSGRRVPRRRTSPAWRIALSWEAAAGGAYAPHSLRTAPTEYEDADGVLWTAPQLSQLRMLLMGSRSHAGLACGLHCPPAEPQSVLSPYLLNLRVSGVEELVRELAALFNAHSESAVRLEVERAMRQGGFS